MHVRCLLWPLEEVARRWPTRPRSHPPHPHPPLAEFRSQRDVEPKTGKPKESTRLGAPLQRGSGQSPRRFLTRYCSAGWRLLPPRFCCQAAAHSARCPRLRVSPPQSAAARSRLARSGTAPHGPTWRSIRHPPRPLADRVAAPDRAPCLHRCGHRCEAPAPRPQTDQTRLRRLLPKTWSRDCLRAEPSRAAGACQPNRRYSYRGVRASQEHLGFNADNH